MISSRVPIIFNTPKNLDYIQLLLAADIHTGSAQFNEQKWNAFEKQLEEENTYVVFCGDQEEYATKQSKSDIYTQKLTPSEQKHWWIERLKKYPDKIVAIIDGNHEYNRASKEVGQSPPAAGRRCQP